MAPTRSRELAGSANPGAVPADAEQTAVLTLEKSSAQRNGPGTAAPHGARGRLAGLTVAAIGVVYGDIGTSPLYTLREAFGPWSGLPLSEGAVLGVLSLIFWALLLVVTIKYVVVIMRADNQGEGGVLALVSLALRGLRGDRAQRVAIVLAMIGAALFFGDGILTPAISVLGAVEGLIVATPAFEPYVVPAAVAILTGLFLVQRRGTGGIGVLFGPVMCLWFGVLALLGALQILANPSVLEALNPAYAAALFGTHQWQAFVALGAVVLAVTGAEALYTDMGHFGRRPIRLAWLGFVLPALLLNYFGQGALLISDPDALANPFYHLAPSWALYPMVVLATAATIIASQAVISGAFSLARQAVQLGYLPRLEIRHTSEHQIGQVYLPRVNWMLMAGVVVVVIGFGSSSALAGAYGIAVIGAMMIDAVLAFAVALLLWRWRPWIAGFAFATFLVVDLAFLGASTTKILQGGWFPILLALAVLLVMSTWRRGRRVLFDRLYREAPTLPSFLASITRHPPTRVPGTAVFLTNNLEVVPRALLHNLKHNEVLHERIVVLRVVTEDVPRVPGHERVQVEHLGGNVHRVLLRYGFLETPDVPAALLPCQLGPPELSITDTSFFLSRETYLPSGRPDLSPWREQLYIHLANGALDATRFFRLPPDRVVELGSQIEI